MHEGITRREDGRENTLIKRTGSKIPNLVRMREQTLAYKFRATGREPNQMHLYKTQMTITQIKLNRIELRNREIS